MKIINKIKSYNYFKKLKNNKIKIKDIKEQYLTSEICFYEIKKHINYFRIMPKMLITNDICIYVFNNCIDYFEFIPDKFKTKEMCKNAINNNYYNIKHIPNYFRDYNMYYNIINKTNDYYNIISLEELPDDLKRLYIDKSIKEKPSNILNIDKRYILEYNWIEAINNQNNLVFKLPNIYKNNEFYKKIISINPEFISKMPLDQLSQNLFDLSFRKNPKLIKYFPDQFITQEMVDYINNYLPQYKKRIPLRYQERVNI